MDRIREHCRNSDFQRPDLYETVSKEEVAGICGKLFGSQLFSRGSN